MTKPQQGFHHGKEEYPTRELRVEWAEGVAAMRAEDPEWCDDRRRAYLRSEATVWKTRIRRTMETYAGMTGRDECLRPLVAEAAETMLRKLKRIEAMLRAVDSPGGAVTPEMIERAREYPIADIVDTKQGRAVCVFHEGARNRNMDVRNGFAYCHKCGSSGDAITVYRKVTGASFPEAVRAMAGDASGPGLSMSFPQ